MTPWWNEMLRIKTVHPKGVDVASLCKVILMHQFSTADLITISTGNLSA